MYINEILTSNITVNRDPVFINYGDWIEIYNAANTTVDLLNYVITDDARNLEKYRISTSNFIGPHSYKLIWADEENYGLNTNFALDCDGEFIALINPDGTIEDSITYTEQGLDISYGRLPDGSNNWVYFAQPTPEITNNSAGIGHLIHAPDVIFSITPGFYTSSQTVAISASSTTGSIHYTTNGSVPTLNSPVYTSPIQISSTTVVKARCYESGVLPGDIGVSTYFINESFDIPVVSLSTDPDNFFSGEYGIYVEGYNGIIGDCYEKPANWFMDWERPLNFEYFETNGERKINKLVGTKLTGQCTRVMPSKSLALISREQYGEAGINYSFFSDKNISSFKSLVLRNSGNDFPYTMLRDGFIQNILIGRMDIDYQSYQPTIVFLNGEYWGILNLREKLNEHYVESNYGINSDSVSVIDCYTPDNHYSNLLNFIENHSLSDQANFDYVNTQMDVNEYLNYYIFNTFVDNEDWPQNNIKLWRENNATGRWRWMLFDTDYGFGLFSPLKRQNLLPNLSYSEPSRKLIIALMQNQNFKNEFIQRFAAHLNTTFEPNREIGILDSIVNIIDDKMPRHIAKWEDPYSYEYWQSNLTVMRKFAVDRIPDMTAQIVKYFGLTGTYHLESSVSGPGMGKIKLCGADITNATQNAYFNDVPVRLEAIPEPGYKFAAWTGEVTSTSNPVSLTFSSDVTIQANFELADTLKNIYINEIAAGNTGITDEQNEQEDWIEIYNANDFAVNIGGLYISDSLNMPLKCQISKDFPELTTIPPQGHLVLWADNDPEQGALHLGFKLNSDGEEVCLAQKIGAGTVILNFIHFDDQYANTTYGRYPDGSDTWRYEVPTIGSTNKVREISGLYINEFCASNTTIIPDENGHFEDWIEIYNTNDTSVDIGGLFITDSLGFPTKYRIPTTSPDSTTIPSHGYLLLWADNKEDKGILHLGFKLGKEGEQIGLARYDGKNFMDSLTYGNQYSNSSSSRYPDGNKKWVYAPSTPGKTNILPVVTGLYVNEFSADNEHIIADEKGDFDDWIEIYNSTDNPVDIGGLFLTDSLGDPAKHRIPTTNPDSTTIPAHGFIILWADNQEEQGALHLDFKLGKNGEQIGLTGYDGINFINSLTYGNQYTNSSSSRFPDGNNKWIFSPSTPGKPNTLPVITGLYINEFSAENKNILPDDHGDYDDWIEIYNSTGKPVDIGGLFLTDSLGNPGKCRIPSTCPDSTTISAKGYRLLWADNQEEQGVLHIGFKLGKDGEQIGLAGYDKTSYIDTLTYGEQYSNSSASRYPNGNNRWIYAPSTPGKTNILPVIKGLFINEFSAENNNIISDEHGDYDDWIEIYNSTDKPVDIGGLFITDSLGNPGKHRIPATNPDLTTIPARDYMLLWADNQKEQGVRHIDFKLGENGEQIGLAGYDKTNYIDTLTYGEQYSNSSVSRYPDGNKNWAFVSATPGGKNKQFETGSLFINEFMPDNDYIIADEYGEFDDWIELYNASDDPVDIGGLFMTDSLGDPSKGRISTKYPDSTSVPAHGFILLWADDQEEQGLLHLDFKLGKTNEAVGLAFRISDQYAFIDSVSYTLDKNVQSYGKIPDGAGDWNALDYPTPYHSNTITLKENNYSAECMLHQNVPNPFDCETTIEYYLPENTQNAMIRIYDMYGVQLKSILLPLAGCGYITIKGSEFKAGMYAYILIVDGLIVDAKKMILSH